MSVFREDSIPEEGICIILIPVGFPHYLGRTKGTVKQDDLILQLSEQNCVCTLNSLLSLHITPKKIKIAP